MERFPETPKLQLYPSNLFKVLFLKNNRIAILLKLLKRYITLVFPKLYTCIVLKLRYR